MTLYRELNINQRINLRSWYRAYSNISPYIQIRDIEREDGIYPSYWLIEPIDKSYTHEELEDHIKWWRKRAKISEDFFGFHFSEKHDNPTPSGGDYSVAYYYDEEDEPCEKENAFFVRIVEYKKGDIMINETFAFLKRT